MDYEQWREELFGHPADSEPVLIERIEEFESISPLLAFDHIDRMLIDEAVHSLYSKEQLGIGINTVYSNCCSNFPFLYTTEVPEERRIQGIHNLTNLYRNYFERYCSAPVLNIGNDQTDGRMGFICYMFWDVFVLYPGNATPAMIAAALDVMRFGLESKNDNCLASVIHGLGHWAFDVPEAVAILTEWLRQPTTSNTAVLQYAEIATTGMIL